MHIACVRRICQQLRTSIMNGNDFGFPVAIKLAGRLVREGGNDLLTSECPSCGSDMNFKDYSGVCLSAQPCGFRRGSPLDYLAMATGGYREAVRKAFPQLDTINSRHVATESMRLRSVLEFLMNLEDKTEESSVERVELRMLAEKGGGYNRDNPAGMIFSTSSETGELYTLLMDAGIDCPSQLAGPCILVPYWDSPSSISMIHIHANRGRINAKVHLNKATWAWSGLSGFHINKGRMLVHPMLRHIVAAETTAKAVISDQRSTQVYVRIDGEEPGWPVGDMVFSGSTDEWVTCFPRWSHIAGFEDAGFMIDGRVANLGEAMAYLVLHVGGGEFTGTRLIAMMESMSLSEETAARLLDTVFRQFGPQWQRDAESILARRVLTRFGKKTLYACPAGYESSQGSESTRLTNFTLKLKDVVGFALSNELSYRGEVRVGSTSFDVSLPGTCLDSPAAMEKELQSRQILGGGNESSEHLSTVLNAKGFKDVCSYLKKSIPTLPRVRGSRILGWTPRQDEYCSTGFTVRGGSVVEAVYIPDNSTSFHPFSPPVTGEVEITAPANIVLQGLVAALVGNVVRAFLDLPYCPEPAHNGTFTRRALGIMFQELGQKSPVRLTSILPRYLEAVKGHPILCIGITPQQAPRAKINGVYLTDKGINLEGTKDEEAAQAGKVLLKIIEEICCRITVGDDIHYPEKRSVALGGRAGVEGAMLIRGLFNIDWDVSDSRYRYTDLLMEERRELLDAAAADADSHMMISTQVIEGIASADDLLAELCLLCEELDSDAGGIKIDRMSYSRIYESYHGAGPPLPTPELPTLSQ